METTRESKAILWFSRILRWALGGTFILIGITSGYDWYAIGFGALIAATGFLRPRRCIAEAGDCASQ